MCDVVIGDVVTADVAAGGGASGAGDGLVGVVARLRGLVGGDLSGLSSGELREAAVGLSSVRAWVEGCSARVLAALAAVGGASAVSAVLAGEGGSGREVRRRHDVVAAVGVAPVFAGALEAGRVSVDHVAALGRVRHASLVADAQHGLLAQALDATPEEFVRRLAAWDDALDADGGASADRLRWAKRRVSFHDRADGMGVAEAVLPPAEQTVLRDAVLHVAGELWRDSGDRTATVAQRHADALIEIVARAMGTAVACARPRTRPPTLTLTPAPAALTAVAVAVAVAWTRR